MGKILRLPKGLQDFLGNTNMGDNPSELSQVVAPVLDLGPFYNAENLQMQSTFGAIGPTGAGFAENGFIIPVPQGEIWYLLAASVGYRETVSGGGSPKMYSTIELTNYPGPSGPSAQQPFLHVAEPTVSMTTAGASRTMSYGSTYFGGKPFPVPGGVDINFRWYVDNLGAVDEGEASACVFYLRLTA